MPDRIILGSNLPTPLFYLSGAPLANAAALDILTERDVKIRI
jgi:hypothetical protein